MTDTDPDTYFYTHFIGSPKWGEGIQMTHSVLRIYMAHSTKSYALQIIAFELQIALGDSEFSSCENGIQIYSVDHVHHGNMLSRPNDWTSKYFHI